MDEPRKKNQHGWFQIASEEDALCGESADGWSNSCRWDGEDVSSGDRIQCLGGQLFQILHPPGLGQPDPDPSSLAVSRRWKVGALGDEKRNTMGRQAQELPSRDSCERDAASWLNTKFQIYPSDY